MLAFWNKIINLKVGHEIYSDLFENNFFLGVCNGEYMYLSFIFWLGYDIIKKI